MPRDREAARRAGLRIDKWLWHARFCKTRALAQKLAEAGHVRLNGARVEKSSVLVHEGAILTVPAHGQVFAIKVLALGAGRGSASEARMLYEAVPDALEASAKQP